MSEKLSFIFELADKVSAPAASMEKATKAMETALGAADKKFKAVDQSVKELDKHLRDLEVQAKKTKLEKTVDPLKKQRLELQLNRLAMADRRAEVFRETKALREQKKAMDKASESTKGYSLATDIMSGMVQRAITGVADLAMKTVSLGVAGAKFATDAIAFKEQTLTALKVMTGTEERAQRIFNEALNFAKKTPFDTRDVLGGFTQLLGAGFKESEVSTVFGAIGDAAAASGFDQQVIDRMVVAFAQIKAKGRLMGQEMLQVNEALGRAGVGTTAIYDEIAKKLGKTRAEVMKLQEAGKVDADSAIFGIIKALEKKSGGAVGNLMAEQSKTLTGLMSTLASAPGDFFMSLDLSKLTGFTAIKGFVENLVKLFDTGSKSGARLMDVAGKLYNTVMEGLFGDVGSDSGLAKMEGIIFRVSDAVEQALPGIRSLIGFTKGLAAGFLGGVFSTLERMSEVSRIMDGGPEAAKTAEKLGTEIGLLASRIVGLVDAVLFAMTPLLWMKETFDGGLDGILKTDKAEETGSAWGKAVSEGLRSGILTSISGPMGAMYTLVDAVTGVYKAETQTHSPSRLFAQYGTWATEGWAKGLTSGIPDAEAAVGGLAGVMPGMDGAGPEGIGISAGAVGGGFAVGGGVVVQLSMPIEVALTGADGESAQSLVDELRRLLPLEIPGVLEQAFALAAAQRGAV